MSILHLLEVGLCVWRATSLKNSPSVGKPLWSTACQWRSLRLGESFITLRTGKQEATIVKRPREREVTPFFHSHFFLMFCANKFSSRQCYLNCWKQVQHSLTQGHPQNEKRVDTKVRASLCGYIFTVQKEGRNANG